MTGYFELLVKRYDEWGFQETPVTHFLFTKTNHTYRPPGIVSTYIHSLKVGDLLSFAREFQHKWPATRNSLAQSVFKFESVDIRSCLGRLPLYTSPESSDAPVPLPAGVKHFTLICVGAGVAPMIQAIRTILRDVWFNTTLPPPFPLACHMHIWIHFVCFSSSVQQAREANIVLLYGVVSCPFAQVPCCSELVSQ